ncbi:hypothetical protein BDK51DRAFT_25465 [Blyttiomyces helicus]|uniref:Uncharacterized protein n=1 Tax=Blyttiomyces helicus TaxID=388810 RepID=A0A4P9WJV9_9FUNG|nr:hypothetical protein BDK51DRAFT_25465 [Blyttiomyces helicus]|eukprot:RKO93239.1 hypothetical protein BDK51DRAFT_25465 [Blyttiomyces helicus]
MLGWPAKKAPLTNPTDKYTWPSTPSSKSAPVEDARVKTKPAGITVKDNAGKNVTWTDDIIIILCNVLAKGPWKSVLETSKDLVEDDNDPNIMVIVLIMFATIKVETKHLANRWATLDKHAKGYIQNRGTTKIGLAGTHVLRSLHGYLPCKYGFFSLGGDGNRLFALQCQ